MIATIDRLSELTPGSRCVKDYIRSIEGGFYDALLDAADRTGLGRGVLLDGQDQPVSDKFTGRGFCLYGSVYLKECLSKFFPEIRANIIAGEINPRDTLRTSSHRIGHFWLHLTLLDQTRLFLDGTYGQINPFLNRMVVDFIENEPQYYGQDVRTFPYTERRDSMQLLEKLTQGKNNGHKTFIQY